MCMATNYRLISLTSQLCKGFETVVRDQLIDFLESNELPTWVQKR